MNYDLIDLEWNATYVDMCPPFGNMHSSQFFQRVSDALCYVMRHEGFKVINYIDDFLGYRTPSMTRKSFDTLLCIMHQLGLDVSQKNWSNEPLRLYAWAFQLIRTKELWQYHKISWT